jgi:hypothetical protein
MNKPTKIDLADNEAFRNWLLETTHILYQPDMDDCVIAKTILMG